MHSYRRGTQERRRSTEREGAAKARALRALGGGRGEGNDGTRGPAERDPAAFEL